MNTLKLHKSLSEQVEILKSRGLIISDDKEAETLLFNANYYRLTGYMHNFKVMGSENYQSDLSLDFIKHLYDFDRKIARIIMFALEDVEETLKSRLSYTITSAYPQDPLIYLRPNIYRDYSQYIRFQTLFYKEVENNSNLPFVKHHINNYGGQLPLWVAVELFTMGNLSALYKNFATKYKKSLAKSYSTGPVQLENWIENLTYTRNHLAHYMRVYNFNFGRTPKKCKNHPKFKTSSNMIFDQLCIASYMYSDPEEWNNYVIPELWQVIDEYSEYISLDSIGFPPDWNRVLAIKVEEATTV